MSEYCHLNGTDHDWQRLGPSAGDRHILQYWCRDCGAFGRRLQDPRNQIEWEYPRLVHGHRKPQIDFLKDATNRVTRFNRKDPVE